jgi:hypothetical protein
MLRELTLLDEPASVVENVDFGTRGPVDTLALSHDFPSVAVRCGMQALHQPSVRVSVDAWTDPAWCPYVLDAELLRPGRRVRALELWGGEGDEALLCGFQVLTRYQSLIGRRNQASAVPRFDRILDLHKALHDVNRPPVRADYYHALDTWQWTLRLEPGCGFEVQAAALFHDVERLLLDSDFRSEQSAKDQKLLRGAQAQLGAKLVKACLLDLGVDALRTSRIAALVARHEGSEHETDLQLIDDADALSFFTLSSARFLDDVGEVHAEKKISDLLARMSPGARRHLAFIRYRQDVAELLIRQLQRGAPHEHELS